MRLRGILSLFLFLLALPAFAAGAHNSNATVLKLSRGKIFPIPPGTDVVSYLEARVRTLNVVIETLSGHEPVDSMHLELGDVFHWLGHIADDRHEFDRAIVLHEKAFEHYSLLKNPVSPRINGLDGTAHSLLHIRKSTRLRKGLRDEGPHEISLRYGKEFSIPKDAEIIPFLEGRAKELLALTVKPGLPHVAYDVVYLEVADIHYWLGQIAADHQEYEKARRHFETAGTYYATTKIKTSSRINNKSGIDEVRKRLEQLSACERLVY